MAELVTKATSRRSGFTLIELLIVVVIIGILAGIAAVQMRSVISRAYETTIKADLKGLATQQEIYYQNNLRYGTLAELTSFRSSDGVTLDLTWLASDGFAARASHSGLTGVECAYFKGDAPEDDRTPATAEEELQCQ